MDWLYYNLIIIIMQNPIQNFRKSSIAFEKPGILSENLKTLTSSNYPIVQYFLLKFRTRLLLTNVYKSVWDFFLFCLDLELFAKIKKDLVSTHSIFTLLLITQDLSKIKKKSRTPFLDIINQKTCVKISATHIKLCGSWKLSKFTIFQAKNLFLGNNTGLP